MKNLYLPIIIVLAILPAKRALADGRDDVLAGIFRCSGIADDRTWLDCFYGAAQPMRAKLGLPPALPAQTRLVPPAVPGAPPVHLVQESEAQPRMPEREKPGFFAKLVGDAEHPLVSNVAMASYEFNRDGMFTLALANGQVWKQVGSNDSSSLAHWNGLASHHFVTITPGVIGTTNLVVSGENRSYKVRRLK